LHNIPEGIAVSAPVLASGGSRTRAFWYTAIATGGEILGAVIAVAFAETLTDSRSAALLALVAGIMITLSVVELGPAGVGLMRQSAPTLDT
jgi:ZIP family zinc transporter